MFVRVLFTNSGYSLKWFNCKEELTPDILRSYRSRKIVNIELAGKQHCQTVDDVKALEISEKNSRLPK